MRDSPKRFYLAGPMSEIPEHNFPLFNRIAGLLREQGYVVFNPAENDDGGEKRTRAFYMRLDIPALLASDAIVLLPDWQTSRGASLEVWIAIDLDLPVYRYDIYDGDIILERVEAPTMDRLPFERGDAPRRRSTHPRRNEP